MPNRETMDLLLKPGQIEGQIQRLSHAKETAEKDFRKTVEQLRASEREYREKEQHARDSFQRAEAELAELRGELKGLREERSLVVQDIRSLKDARAKMTAWQMGCEDKCRELDTQVRAGEQAALMFADAVERRRVAELEAEGAEARLADLKHQEQVEWEALEEKSELWRARLHQAERAGRDATRLQEEARIEVERLQQHESDLEARLAHLKASEADLVAQGARLEEARMELEEELVANASRRMDLERREAEVAEEQERQRAEREGSVLRERQLEHLDQKLNALSQSIEQRQAETDQREAEVEARERAVVEQEAANDNRLQELRETAEALFQRKKAIEQREKAVV